MRDGLFGSMLVVTTETVPGFEVTYVIGEVCGVSAQGRNAYTAGIKELTGTANPRMNEELAHARDQAIAEMTRNARRRGANAVIGMRFDNRDITTGWAEICAYGTAVRVERIPPRPAPRMIGSARPPHAEYSRPPGTP